MLLPCWGARSSSPCPCHGFVILHYFHRVLGLHFSKTWAALKPTDILQQALVPSAPGDTSLQFTCMSPHGVVGVKCLGVRTGTELPSPDWGLALSVSIPCVPVWEEDMRG